MAQLWVHTCIIMRVMMRRATWTSLFCSTKWACLRRGGGEEAVSPLAKGDTMREEKTAQRRSVEESRCNEAMDEQAMDEQGDLHWIGDEKGREKEERRRTKRTK